MAEGGSSQAGTGKRKRRLRNQWRRITTFAEIADQDFDRANRWVIWTLVAHFLPFGILGLLQYFALGEIRLDLFVTRGMVAALALGLLVTTFSHLSQSTRQSTGLHALSVLFICLSAFLIVVPDLMGILKKVLPATPFLWCSFAFYAAGFLLAYGAQLLRLAYADDVDSLNIEEEAQHRISDLQKNYEDAQ